MSVFTFCKTKSMIVKISTGKEAILLVLLVTQSNKKQENINIDNVFGWCLTRQR